jgi:aryl-alcohol dehydrogenase-like predicted oxidoreductase
MMSHPALTKRRLGRTHIEVTPIGLGGAWLGQTPEGFSDEIAAATVHRALELGINLIDTSPLYGESERRIGLALEEWYRRGGKREDFILSTKTGTRTRPKDYSADGTKRSVEESLRLLKTDYVDVMLVHDPDDLTPVLSPGGALEALQELKSQGVIQAIGLGVRQHEFHQRCIATGEFDMVLTYRDFNLMYQTAADGVLKHAAAGNVGVFNAMAVMYGLFSGRDPREAARNADPSEIQRARALWEWAQARGVNLLALNLQFCMREPRITSTLVGVANPEQIEEDVAAISETIPEEVWQELPNVMREA